MPPSPLSLLVRPYPVAHFGHVFQMSSYIRFVFRKQIVALSDQWRCQPSNACGLSHRLNAEMIAARFIEHDHVEWCGGRFLFIKNTHVGTGRMRASMDHLGNSPCIAVEVKHDPLIFPEVLI